MYRPLVPAVACVVLSIAACSDEGGSVEAFCETARGFVTDNPALVFDRYDPDDPGGAIELLRGEGTRLHDWADASPAEIDNDVELIADTADALADTFADPDTSARDREELVATFDEVERASAAVTAFARQHCGVELDPAATPTSAP